jgi:hypothetical protein
MNPEMISRMAVLGGTTLMGLALLKSSNAEPFFFGRVN